MPPALKGLKGPVSVAVTMTSGIEFQSFTTLTLYELALDFSIISL